jgi:hypothetical protein
MRATQAKERSTTQRRGKSTKPRLALLAHAYLELTRAHATAAQDLDGAKKGVQIRRWS